ncbi:MAG: hypothetical protein HFG41_05960 [Coprococcus sp.]|nr:hypothetical protein [Coprococcus sp.]
MSVRITISYIEREELEEILLRLAPMITSWKISKNQEGGYQKAYVELKNLKKPEKTS